MGLLDAVASVIGTAGKLTEDFSGKTKENAAASLALAQVKAEQQKTAAAAAKSRNTTIIIVVVLIIAVIGFVIYIRQKKK